MRIFELLDDLYVIQLDVEVLVDTLQHAPDLNVVLQLDRHLVVDERFEKATLFGFSRQYRSSFSTVGFLLTRSHSRSRRLALVLS